MSIFRKSKGFTLIELLLVISIISLLSSIVLASLNSARAKARDAKRLSDMHQMQIALDMYLGQFGGYPGSDFLGCGTWDVSGDGTFITPLVSNKFLPSNISDPSLDAGNNCGNYRYYRYPAGGAGCDSARGAYYVLGIFVTEKMGTGSHPSSPGWSCPARNWQGEMSWVTGKFEK
ncbi:MAG: fimbrial protein pilin [Parcubacteria group bacterium GW2011_GWC1_42_11]|nr:MAG: fimbrial protein pilin [Parcubacteria group bacterium GW2011_GWC1_42_11]